MTLILGYTAPEFVIVASDRMATWSRIDNTRPKGEREVKQYVPQITKTVMWNGFLWAFSGVADLGSTQIDTSEWLMDKLHELNIDPAKKAQPIAFIAHELIQELDRLNGLPSRIRRSGQQLWFSLLVAGFQNVTRDPNEIQVIDSDAVVDEDSGEPLGVVAGADPFMAVLSNASDQRLGQSRVTHHRNFWFKGPSVSVPNHEFNLWAIGSTPPESHLENAADIIRRYRKRHPNQCLEIAKTLVRLMVARSWQQPGVGSTCQVTIIPRSAAGLNLMDSSFVGIREPLEVATNVEFNPTTNTAGTTISNGIGVVAGGAIWGKSQFSNGPDLMGPADPFTAPKLGTGELEHAYPRCPSGDGLARIYLTRAWVGPRSD